MNDILLTVITGLITGGVAAAAVRLIESVAVHKLKRKDQLQDRAEEKNEKCKNQEQAIADMRTDIINIKSEVSTITNGQRVILHDRIKYLGKNYLCDEEIDLDDRRDLLEMHDVYHSLGGNGNLTKLIEEVSKLPLIKN